MSERLDQVTVHIPGTRRAVRSVATVLIVRKAWRYLFRWRGGRERVTVPVVVLVTAAPVAWFFYHGNNNSLGIGVFVFVVLAWTGRTAINEIDTKWRDEQAFYERQRRLYGEDGASKPRNETP